MIRKDYLEKFGEKRWSGNKTILECNAESKNCFLLADQNLTSKIST